MFFHDKRLQYPAKPDRPDPLFAKRLQEALGGQYGEMSVMMQYLFQGWNCRAPAKYRDMIQDIGAEEIGHVEMLATMICRLLEGATAEDQEAAAKSDGVVGAILGGTNTKDAIVSAAANPQHWICNGLGAAPNDSVGFPWTARYIISSGNLMADFRANVNAEAQGRLQVCRIYQMTEDKGVRDMLRFMIARDYYHQQQWLAAIDELVADGLEKPIVPGNFPESEQDNSVAYLYMSQSDPDGAAKTGRWATGKAYDGSGKSFTVADPDKPRGEAPTLAATDPRSYGTPPKPVPAATT